MSIRFVSKATVNNKLVKSSNVWDGTAVYNSFTLVGNYDALGTVTVPSGGLSSITFAGIPQTGYSHLQLRYTSLVSSASNHYFRFNGDSANNYSWHEILGSGSAASSAAGSNASLLKAGYSASSSASYSSAGVIDILDYKDLNKYKTARVLAGTDINGAGGFILFRSGNWRSTSAINQITMYLDGGSNWAQYSQFALYGVK